MRYQVLKDQLEIYDKYRVHWAIWTYKDIGLQGLVHADPKSAWMERLRPFLDKKARLGADRWGSRDDGIRDALEPVEALMEREFPDFRPYPFGRKWLIHRLLRHVLISEAVSAVVEGPGGILENLEPGQRLVDLSTTAPEVTERLALAVAEKGCAMLDAPVSGGEAGAEAASLSIMCGGPTGLFNELKPILQSMGSTVVRVGENGAGQVAKLANNMIVGAAFTAATEAFALAATAGIDPTTLHEAIRGGWAGSPVLDVTAEALSSGDFSPGGTVDLLSKDLGYARNLARSRMLPMPVTAMVDEVFTAAKARGDGERAQPIIIKMWEDLTGLKVSGKYTDEESPE